MSVLGAPTVDADVDILGGGEEVPKSIEEKLLPRSFGSTGDFCISISSFLSFWFVRRAGADSP